MNPIGSLPGGGTVHAVTIANDRISATFLTLGARLFDCRFENSRNLVPHVAFEDLLTTGEYTGGSVGPVMNRLSGAKAPLDGRMLTFEANEGANLLHSGKDGIHRKLWDVVEATDTRVVFALELAPDSFPGNRRIEVCYAVDADELHLDITATTDAATLMNVGFHPYWTLTGGGPTDHEVTVAAERFVKATPDNIPTGEIVSVAGTDRDFRTARVPDMGIDNSFELTQSERPAKAVRLNGGGFALDVITDAPAIHVFTGQPYGIAVEPEIFPDAPNQPGFPSIRLGPDQTFRQKTIHRFSRS